MYVRIKETGAVYATISEAILAAQTLGLSTYFIEILGSFTETSDVEISSRITIASVGGSFTITGSGRNILVQNGGFLILGDRVGSNTLTVKLPVKVLTDGYIQMQAGAVLDVEGTGLELNGENASGIITGGIIKGIVRALCMLNGASLSEISGGEFYAIGEVANVSNSRIDKIAGGGFYQTSTAYTMYSGHALFLNNDSLIGEISGGFFETQRNSALYITQGSRVDLIRGGEFVANRVGELGTNPHIDTRNAAICVIGSERLTSVGEISGGYCRNSYFGVWLANEPIGRDLASIGMISGGEFEGAVGLGVDKSTMINEIVGGRIVGNTALFNLGSIIRIGGSAEIIGELIGLNNSLDGANEGVVDIIDGGFITATNAGSSAVSNKGNIKEISEGVIIGGTAVYCFDSGKLGKITGGVFWGKSYSAVHLGPDWLALEPGLEALIGKGRYQAKGTVIFDGEGMPLWPTNMQLKTTYYMSFQEVAVEGIEGTRFRYLTVNIPEGFGNVVVNGSFAQYPGGGIYTVGETVEIKTSERPGYVFDGWTSTNPAVVFEDPYSLTTAFVMPSEVEMEFRRLEVTANWSREGGEETFPHVHIGGSYAADSGTGDYAVGEVVSISAGERANCSFEGWTTDSQDIDLVDLGAGNATFIMPPNDVALKANWTCANTGNPNGIKSAAAQVISSIAMEELALGYILNAEGEKIQYAIGTLESVYGPLSQPSIKQLFCVNEKVRDTVFEVAMSQMYLIGKLASVAHAYKNIVSNDNGNCDEDQIIIDE
ncbi:MAG: hypothetical protein FWG10_02040 [Eubacteriaceae bacterium]|nr:hypothetical protein [Eubacteriaceae bacterium]